VLEHGFGEQDDEKGAASLDNNICMSRLATEEPRVGGPAISRARHVSNGINTEGDKPGLSQRSPPVGSRTFNLPPRVIIWRARAHCLLQLMGS
jgi:hypothetical protein